MSEHIIHANDDNFTEQVLNATQPVLVDFWAEWCGPCKMVSPILDEIAQDFAGKIHIAKVNVDESQNIPAQYGIRSIPTLILFVNGEAKATKIGAVSKSQLTAFIEENL